MERKDHAYISISAMLRSQRLVDEFTPFFTQSSGWAFAERLGSMSSSGGALYTAKHIAMFVRNFLKRALEQGIPRTAIKVTWSEQAKQLFQQTKDQKIIPKKVTAEWVGTLQRVEEAKKHTITQDQWAEHLRFQSWVGHAKHSEADIKKWAELLGISYQYPQRLLEIEQQFTQAVASVKVEELPVQIRTYKGEKRPSYKKREKKTPTQPLGEIVKTVQPTQKTVDVVRAMEKETLGKTFDQVRETQPQAETSTTLIEKRRLPSKPQAEEFAKTLQGKTEIKTRSRAIRFYLERALQVPT